QPALVRLAERSSVLLVEGRNRGRMAIPLNQVARLEEFPRSRIEWVADRRVVQYGGAIMPLLDVDAVLGSAPPRVGARSPAHARRGGGAELPEDKEAFQVVVYARQERPFGLIVERILDIVEQDSEVQGPPSRPGVECMAVIQGSVTEMLDVEALIQTA